MANKTNSLSYTKWMCKYHIVFIPKYRRKAIYGQYRADLQEIIRTLCKYKGVEILEGHKTELLYLQEFDSIEHFKAEMEDYLDYYNNRRIKLKLNGLTLLCTDLKPLKLLNIQFAQVLF